jgi:hypothetical protein
MYEHETVEHGESRRTALLSCSKQRTKRLLSRQVATERETWVRERVHHIEDFFKAGQVALDFRVPHSQWQAFEKQEGAIGQQYVVCGPGGELLVSGAESQYRNESLASPTGCDIPLRATKLPYVCLGEIAWMTSSPATVRSV